MENNNAVLLKMVEEVLENVRPYLIRDGGDYELVGVEDGIVKLRLKGTCGTCMNSTFTLKIRIERALKEAIPEIKEVQRAI